jgi:hypothetical protein
MCQVDGSRIGQLAVLVGAWIGFNNEYRNVAGDQASLANVWWHAFGLHQAAQKLKLWGDIVALAATESATE